MIMQLITRLLTPYYKEIKLIIIKLLNVFNVSLVATDRQKVLITVEYKII